MSQVFINPPVMNKYTDPPFYQKLSLTLISISLICAALFFGKDIILPILYSILLANILLPFIQFLEHKKINKSLSIFIPVLVSVIVMAGVMYFLSRQLVSFIDDLPELKQRVNEVSHSAQVWFRQTTDITIRKQNEYINETVSDNTPELVGLTFDSILGILIYVLLIPLYTFLILYHKRSIKSFLIGAFKNGSEERVREVLNESTKIAQHYIMGLLIETMLVFILNVAGFLILGIKYPVLLALFAAILNLIPYVGILVANVICMLITLASSYDISNVIWVGVILGFVQVLDNNFGMPLIVGNKVKINALATIIGVLIGGALCGVSGMFLAIPALAVLKVIFDKVPELQPWGLLIGESTEQEIVNSSAKINEKHVKSVNT
jgi:predicted PurR-regulated permease PerM